MERFEGLHRPPWDWEIGNVFGLEVSRYGDRKDQVERQEGMRK